MKSDVVVLKLVGYLLPLQIQSNAASTEGPRKEITGYTDKCILLISIVLFVFSFNWNL